MREYNALGNEEETQQGSIHLDILSNASVWQIGC